MTENEALNIIFAQAECEAREHNCDKDKCDECELLYMQGTVREHREALQMAIQALEKQSMVNEILNELREYSAIGTIDEFKALKEKNTPKKVAYQGEHEKCPICGSFHVFGKHCTECGQVVDYD